MPSMLYDSTQAIPSKGEIAHSESSQQGQVKKTCDPEEYPDTQDANMKDAPSCEKCGQTFPWNQLHLRWKHKCSGSAQSSKPVAKTAATLATHEVPAVATSEVPTVAMYKAQTVGTPDAPTIARPDTQTVVVPEEQTVATLETPIIATPEEAVATFNAPAADSSREQQQLYVMVSVVIICFAVF